MQSLTEKGRRILSFDGGGPRALSQLEILGKIMYLIQYDRDDPDTPLLPCDYFDMMGGSDTGGLIVLMLTKMRMSVDQAHDNFLEVCREVYSDPLMSPTERTARLRDCVEGMLLAVGLPIDLKLVQAGPKGSHHCGGFVVAIHQNHLTQKAILRTYRTRSEHRRLDITVVDAILATCASQPDFLPVTIGVKHHEQHFIGAGSGLRTSNPIRELISEAHVLFSGSSRVASLVSFGSGHPGVLALPKENGDESETFDIGSAKRDGLLKVVRGSMMDAEQTAQEMGMQMGHLGVYFRFSVDQGMRHDGGVLCEDVTNLEDVSVQTDAYMEDCEVSRRMDNCVENLESQLGLPTLEQLKFSGGGQAIHKGRPPVTVHFVPRDGPWKKIVNGMTGSRGGHPQQKIMIVSGMGGCGKTQLVTMFFNKYETSFEYVFFIDGSSEASIRADLITHARSVLPNCTSGLKEALSFFQDPRNFFKVKERAPWLLVYDNVDDVRIPLVSFLPECTFGCILVTTRNLSLSHLATSPQLHLELGPMSPSEATEVILRSARRDFTKDNRRWAAPIAEALGNLPVALIQAGCYIFESKCSGEEYLALISLHRGEMLDVPAGDRQKSNAYAAFDLSYKQLAPHLQKLLHLLSFFHFADFPVAAIPFAARKNFSEESYVLEEHGPGFDRGVQLLYSIFCPGGKWDDRFQHSIVMTLQNHSIASVALASNTLLIRLHPLLHGWAMDRIPLAERPVYKEAASRLLACGASEYLLSRYLITHVDEVLSKEYISPTSMNDRASFGYLLRAVGREKDAQVIWLNLYETVSAMKPPAPLSLCIAGIGLAETYREELKTKQKLEEECVRIRESLLGGSHKETMEAKSHLAYTYFLQGQFFESKLLYEELVGEHRKRLGRTHLETLNTMGQLARTYQDLGRYSDAKALLTTIIEELKAQLGENHPSTLLAMGYYGWTLYLQGRYAEAEAVYIPVLKTRTDQLGETHPLTTAAINSLALVHREQGNYEKAVELQEKCLRIDKQQLGETHPETLIAKGNLAWTYRLQERFAEAQAVQEELLAISMESLGQNHPHTLVCMDRLSSTLEVQQRYEEAEELQIMCLVGVKKRLGLGHVDTAMAMYNLAVNYYVTRRFSEARGLARETERIQRSGLGKDHPHYQLTVKLLGDIGDGMGPDGDDSLVVTSSKLEIESQKGQGGSEEGDRDREEQGEEDREEQENAVEAVSEAPAEPKERSTVEPVESAAAAAETTGLAIALLPNLLNPSLNPFSNLLGLLRISGGRR